jgi:hypothetical protein
VAKQSPIELQSQLAMASTAAAVSGILPSAFAASIAVSPRQASV